MEYVTDVDKVDNDFHYEAQLVINKLLSRPCIIHAVLKKDSIILDVDCHGDQKYHEIIPLHKNE